MYHFNVLSQSYLHRLDPFAIQITETLGLRWYGLAYIAGFITAWAAIVWLGKRNIFTLPPKRVGDFMFACVLGVLLGGRLGYVLFYDPSLLISFSSQLPWWGALAIQDGGMASHGGIIGVCVALIIWGKKNKVSKLHLLDIAALFTTPGLFYGRIANFINGELWGKALPAQLQNNTPWWSVTYPTEITEVWTNNPEQYYTQLEALEPLRAQVVGGDQFYQTIVMEAYAGNQQVIETIQPLLTAWYPSQLIQALTEGPILFFILVLIWWKPRKPGVIGGWFALSYGVMRIGSEMYRQPDEGVALFAGLSRGQLLSVGMVLFGIVFIAINASRPSEKIGGFGSLFTKPKTT